MAEIARPTANLKPLMFVLGLVIVSGAFIFFAFMYLKSGDNAEKEPNTINSTVDSSFYSVPEKNDNYMLLPQDQKRERGSFNNENRANPTVEKGARFVINSSNGSESDDKKPIIEDANDAFIRPKRPTREQLIALRRAQLNASRRVVTNFQATPHFQRLVAEKKQKEILPPPKDKDFSSQEIAKDLSTFPVDLERTITADRYIDCVLVDFVNSMLEGRVTCQIEKNIYGYHGRKILIPAGSKAMGTHGVLKKVGDERFNITWNRILRPDGVNIKITKGFTADRVGATGIEGEVDNRNTEKYGGAVLTSTISALAQMAIPTENTIQNQVIQSYGTDIGQVTAAMLNDSINIKPFATVPMGTRIKIIPTTDIWLKNVGGNQMFVQKEQ